MNILRFAIESLAAVSLKRMSEIADGQPFIDEENLCVLSTVNGKFRLYVRLTGPDAPVAQDLKNAGGRPLPVFAGELSVDAKGLSAPLTVRDDLNILGNIVVLASGEFGICADLPDKNGGATEPARIAFLPASGITEFHDRNISFAVASWEMTWRDEAGRPVVSLTRQAA